MKIIITGAKGLVGSAISKRLETNIDTELLKIGRDNCDLENKSETDKVFNSFSPDIVIHCAGKVFGIGGNMANQYDSWIKNTIINMNVIEASRQSKVKHLISLGTGCVYPSEIVEGGYSETQLWDGNVDNSEYGYAHSKRHMLAGLQSLEKSSDFKFTYIVSCNLFGPNDSFNEDTGHVIPSLISKFEKKISGENSKVSLWGNGSAVRDFLSSIEMARALEFFVREGPHGIVNVCSGVKRSIKDVIYAISDISGVSEEDFYWDHSKPNGQNQRYYKNKKLRDIGFNIQDTFKKDLETTYKWYLQNKKDARR